MKSVQVIAITGGKGGVGKSTTAVNLAVTIAEKYPVMLLDADLGLANVDILLGLRARHNISHVLNGECELADIIMQGPGYLKVVPAASGTQKMAELSAAEHAGFIQAFSALNDDLDYLIIDTAAGISDTVVSFAKASDHVLIVVCDEPTSLTDAYALMKILHRDHKIENFHVIANMTRSSQEGHRLFQKLTKVTTQFLDVNLHYLGAIPFAEEVREAIRAHQPLCLKYPKSGASLALHQLADKVAALPKQQQHGMAFFFERLLHDEVIDKSIR